MDPIEILEHGGYVVDKIGNPEQWVYLSDIRPYVIQRARAANAIFTSEIRAYMVTRGRPDIGVAVNGTATYIVTHEEISGASSTATNAIRTQRPGVVARKAAMYSIEPSGVGYGGMADGSGDALSFETPGVVVKKTTMYTIEVP